MICTVKSLIREIAREESLGTSIFQTKVKNKKSVGLTFSQLKKTTEKETNEIKLYFLLRNY